MVHPSFHLFSWIDFGKSSHETSMADPRPILLSIPAAVSRVFSGGLPSDGVPVPWVTSRDGNPRPNSWCYKGLLHTAPAFRWSSASQSIHRWHAALLPSLAFRQLSLLAQYFPSFIFPSHHPSILPSFWFPPRQASGILASFIFHPSTCIQYSRLLHIWFLPTAVYSSRWRFLSSCVQQPPSQEGKNRQTKIMERTGQDTVSGDGQSWHKILWEASAGWEGKRENGKRIRENW